MDFSIGEVSRRSRVKIPTIRYYEQIGLLEVPKRTEGKQRRYESADLGRLNFIRHARELGFEIGPIRELLEMGRTPDQPCAAADEIARRHLGDVERRISQLIALRGELQRMVEECGHGRVGECRVIQVLGDHSHCETDHAAAAHARAPG
ncbi:MerR family transcriptional regulator [Microvirga antarctica]|uniref:MerR family transcriptional regulator n=1 Tax=Microvirga antarctica TaxID=2819233 RepID=UPI001B3033D7|nr:helix-turn-helix domain-containing protein [Microvirga antarctica]